MSKVKSWLVSVLSATFLYMPLLADCAVAQISPEDRIINEATLVFTWYQEAFKAGDYEKIFSLEPNFLQKSIGSADNYKSFWSDPAMDEWRSLYYSAAIKEVKPLGYSRAIVLISSEDQRLSNASYYIFQEDGSWKVSGLGIILQHTQEELKKLAEIIKQFYEKNKRLPDSLVELVPEYIEALPVDLFNDNNESFYYIKNDEMNFRVYSLGPDGKDSLGNVEYSYENGLLSEGDIIGQ